jgi:pimeloyl-ACP methyl ester carboxylesterase
MPIRTRRSTLPPPAPEPVPVSDHGTSVNGAATRYWIWGESDAEITIVAVHGFRGDHHGLLPIVARLRGCRVITPDLPGFGRSAPFPAAGPRHDVVSYADWLTAFCSAVVGDRPEHGRVIVVGHSFGAIVCAAAVAGGLAVDRLVLINPISAPALQGPRAILSKLAVLYHRIGGALPERIGYPLLANRLVVRFVSETVATTKDPALRRWIHDQHRRYFSGFANRRVVVEGFTASVSHDVTEFADGIAVPTLLIAGDIDDLAPIGSQHRLATLIDTSELAVLPDVGHLIHYERPAEAAELIMEFAGAADS